jgi:TIR domain
MPIIFVSYRRQDSDAITGRIAARLRVSYGKKAVFVDVSSIPIAAEFPARITKAVRGCRVLVAVIGPGWHGPATKGPDRIQTKGDFVRMEIELARSSGAELFPVLVGSAAMPPERALPASLRFICDKQAARIDAGADFDHHMRRLIASIDQALIAAMRWRAYAVRAGLCVLGVITVLLGLGAFSNGLVYPPALGAAAGGLGLALGYAALHRMLRIDVPRRAAAPLGIVSAAAAFAAFVLLPGLLRPPPVKLGSQREILASIKELQDEFARARAVLERTGSADFSGAEAIAVSLGHLDRENGHALYYQGEIARVQAGAHFTPVSCPKPIPNKEPQSLDVYRKEFYRYIEVERTLPARETGGGFDWAVCYKRIKGYCIQRTAWINHLIANDYYQEALATSDRDNRLGKLRDARQHAELALKYRRPDGVRGFSQCIDTQVLITKIDRGLARDSLN